MHQKVGHPVRRRWAGNMRRVFRRAPCLLALLAILGLAILREGDAVAFADGAAPGQLSSSPSSVRLRGRVVRFSADKNSEIAVSDAIVTLCHGLASAQRGSDCESLATTVTDAHGEFELSLDNPELSDVPYSLRVQGPEGELTTSELGPNPAEWPSSVKLALTDGDTERGRLSQATTQTRRQLTALAQKTSESEAQTAKLRWHLSELMGQQSTLEAKLLPNPEGRKTLSAQIDELRKQQLQTKDEIAALERHRAQFKDQQDKLNIDLGKIFEQQERERRQSGVNTHRVLFGTDRAVSGAGEQAKLLNLPNSEGATTLGVCEASIDLLPGDARPAQQLKPTPDADRYYAVQSVQALGADKFWAQAEAQLQLEGSHDALLFIHGYRSSFNDSCRRAAQIAADLKFSGPVFLWSWPSRNELSGYFSDEKMAAWSSVHFTAFLKQVLSQRHLRHLHIVAHSMGSRVLEQAIISPGITAAEQAHLGQIIFAAPDLSRSAFDSECNPGRISALRITLYASRHDEALRAAKIAHPFPRLGDANPDIDIRTGMDSIDASAVDTSLIGHSYIGNSRGVLADVADLISSNAAPDSRHRLTRMGRSPRQWWLLNP